MNSIEDLKGLEETLKKDLNDKSENMDLWKRVLALVHMTSTEGYECFPDRESKDYFFGNFTEALVNGISLMTTITNGDFRKLLQLVLEAYLSLLIKEIPKENTALVNSLKPIFDPNIPLYQVGFADLKNREISYIPPVDPTWRTSLSVGMKIDAVREEKYPEEKIEGWARATIISIIGDNITIKHDGLLIDIKSTVIRDSVSIAPLGYRTGDWDWRDKIAEGDRVDAYDTQGKWYLSTVMDTKVDKDNIKSLQVAYRVYFSEGGKIDNTGRHHEGWSETYDTWISAYSIKIQRPNTISKLGTVYCRRILDDEYPAPDDSKDILLNAPVKGDSFVVIHRSFRNNSSLYLELVKAFGAQKGFDLLTQKIQTDKFRVSLDFIIAAIDLVSGPHYLYHRTFITETVNPLVMAFLSYLQNIPEEEHKKTKKDTIYTAIQKLEHLMRRVFTAKNKGEELIKLKIGISLSLLRSNQLEKRIQAIRLISETCKAAKYSHDLYFQTSLPAANDNIIIMGLLQASQIIEEIFGKRSHIQLILRSTDILKFFLQNGNITKKDFDVIWNCCENDEQSRVEIFKVISESCMYFPMEMIGILIGELDAKPRSQLREQDVELICDLGSYQAKTTPEMIKSVLTIMWDIICKTCPAVSDALVNKTMTKFCDYITSPSRVPESIMKIFFSKCFEMLSTGSNSLLALQILRKSLVQLPTMIQFSSKSDMVYSILEEGEVVKNYFKDWISYMAQIPTKISDMCFDKEAHKLALEERKDFLLFLSNYAKFKLSKDHLGLLWNLLVKESIFPEEQTVFYKVMKEIVSLGYLDERVTSISELSTFFSTVMCSEENNFTHITLEGVQAFESLILAVNKHLEKIVEIGVIRKPKKFIIGPQQYNYLDDYYNKEEEIEFIVKTLPTQIVGESVLWKIVLESKSETITSKSIELLNKLYTKLSEEISDRIAEISNIFIEKATSRLKIFYERSINNNENHTNEIVKLLRLIEEMLDDSEKKGNNGITPLLGLIKGHTLKLQIINYAVDTIMNPQIPDKFELTVHSRITIWHLKMLVASKIQLVPELLTFSINANALSERDNGKLLEYCKIEDGETIKVTKKSEEFKARVELISKAKLLTERAKEVFSEIFERFSTDGKMTPADCASFSRVCLSDRFIDANDYQVQQLFKQYDKEGKGYLSKEKFLSFYESSSHDREDTVWNNLKELGYGPDLVKLDESKTVIMTSLTSYSRLPRYILANEKGYFDFLMNLVKMGGEISLVTWNLLYRCAPSEEKLLQVLNFFSSEKVDFNTLFSPENYCESIYYLFLAEAILSDLPSEEILQVQKQLLPEERLNWKGKFLEYNGLIWALDTLHSLTCSPALNIEGMQIYTKMLLDLITIYILSSLEINKKIEMKYKHFSYTYIRQKSGASVGDGVVDVDKNIIYKKSENKKEYDEKLAEGYLNNYQELIAILKGEIGEKLLISFDIEKYVVCSLKIMKVLIDIPIKPTENTAYLFQNLSIVMKLGLVYKPGLYKIVSKNGLKEIFLKGIIYQNYVAIREIFQQLTYFLVANVKIAGSSIKEIPLGDLINDMMDSRLLLLDTDTEELFELLCVMVDLYKMFDNKETAFNIGNKLNEMLIYLTPYRSKESPANPQPDKILIGLLQLTSQLVKAKESSRDLSNEARNKIIDEVFFNYLFPLRKTSEEMFNYKCKTLKSRDAAYKLLLSLAKFKDECVFYMLKECITPLLKIIPEVSSWGFSPEQHQKSPSGFVGIKNLGNICYINSMLQQFFMIVPMRYSLLGVDDGKPVALNEQGIDDNLIHQFQRMFAFLSFSSRRDFDPSQFCFSYKESDGRPLMTQIQRDASEFLSILFDRLERFLSPTSYKYLLQNIFGGKSCSQVICSECGYVSSTYEPYYTLSLEIKNQRTLYEALNRFISGNSVSGYKCSGCQKHVDVEKRILLSSLPNIMIVHLQRFSFNFDTLANEKIHSRLEFPTVLNMKPYTEEGQEPHKEKERKLERAESLDEEKENIDEITLQKKHSEMEEKEANEIKSTDVKKEVLPDEYYIYKLVGVVVHNGNADSGHYYSFINVDRNGREDSEDYLQTEKQRWVEFNDSVVSEFSFSRLEAECFGGAQEDIQTDYNEESQELAKILGGRSKSAYMLIYERKKKGMIPVAIEDSEIKEGDMVLSSLECIGTALSRAQKEGVRIIGTDHSKNHFLFYPFYQLPYRVPPNHVKEISDDNRKFLYEALIYNKEFICFFNDLYFHSTISYEYSSSTIYKKTIVPYLSGIGTKFMLDIFSHAILAEIYSLSSTGDRVSKMLLIDTDESRALLNRCIAEPGKMFGVLVRCQEPVIRSNANKLLTSAFIAILNVEKETPLPEGSSEILLSIKFMETLVSLIGYDLSSEWVKFRDYFELLRDLVISGGDTILNYCFAKDLITILLDFFLEKKSPKYSPSIKRYEMGNLSSNPCFSPLMELVNFLTIHAELIIGPKRVIPPTIIGLNHFELSPMALKCLNEEEVITKHIRCGGTVVQINKLLLHLSYENKKYSKMVCKMIIKAINEYDITKSTMHFSLISEMVLLNDPYQLLRIEWIFGYQFPVYKSGYGLTTVIDIIDEVNNFHSPLGFERRDDPLLHQIWKMRLRYEGVVAGVLKLILGLVGQCDPLYHYLKMMPPPCYAFVRYTDWIEPFLEYYSQTHSTTSSELKEKESIISEIRILLQEYETRVRSEELIPVQLYMIGKTLEIREIKEMERMEKNVKMTVSEIVTEVYPSKPMMTHNPALSGSYLVEHFDHYKYNANSKIETSLPVMETKPIPVIKVHNVDDPQHEETKMSMQEDLPIENKKSEEKMEVGKSEPDKMMVDSAPVTEKPIESMIDIEQNIQEDNNKMEIGSPDHKISSKLFQELPSLLRIDLENFGNVQANVKIQIKHKEGSFVNFYCPISANVVQVSYGMKILVLLLQKNYIDQPWGEFEILFHVKGSKENEMSDISHAQAHAELHHGATQATEGTAMPQHPDNGAISDIPSASNQTISCPRCTVDNPPGTIFCIECCLDLNNIEAYLQSIY